MTIVNSEMYIALLAAGVSEEKAAAAAKVIADYGKHFRDSKYTGHPPEQGVDLLIGLVVLNLVLSITLLWKLLG